MTRWCDSRLGLWLVAAIAGCGTAAVGVEDCRELENARCEAAVACPDLFQIRDLAACKRFYRDQCLHGLATNAPPGAPTLHRCVQSIGALSSCALKYGEEANVSQCSLKRATTEVMTVCETLQRPETLVDCGFLIPPEPAPTPEVTGGAGGAGGKTATGGAGGTSGAASSTGGTQSSTGGDLGVAAAAGWFTGVI